MSNKVRKTMMRRLRKVKRGEGFVLRTVNLGPSDPDPRVSLPRRYILKNDGRYLSVRTRENPNGTTEKYVAIVRPPPPHNSL